LSGRALFLSQNKGVKKKIYTDEEIKQHKRDYYKNNYYVNHREVCLERARKSHFRQKAAQAK